MHEPSFKKTYLKQLLLLLSFPVVFFSCKTVRPYQRAFLNDEAMQAGKRAGEKFAGAVHSNREASAGGGSGKVSGGCGCN